MTSLAVAVGVDIDTQEEDMNMNMNIDNQIFYAAFCHKDSEQKQPLFDALHLRTGNIEIDVHLIDNQLLVGHDREHCKPELTFESMYLAPLKQLIQERHTIWPPLAENNNNNSNNTNQFRILRQPLNIFIDFKSDGRESLVVLHEMIVNKYANIVTSWTAASGSSSGGDENSSNSVELPSSNSNSNAIDIDNDNNSNNENENENEIRHQRFLNLIITGNRDIQTIRNYTRSSSGKIRYVAYDGRIEDLTETETTTTNYISHELMPFISDSFKKIFPGGKAYISWMSETDEERLKQYILLASKAQKRLRFWATCDQVIIRDQIWMKLIRFDANRNVIVINSDVQKILIPFLKQNEYPTKTKQQLHPSQMYISEM